MDRKTFPCLQNASHSQHVPTRLSTTVSQLLNYNCKKSPFLRTPAFIFCLPWGCFCRNHAKRCMNEKTIIQCLPNPSQHVPIYLQQFPNYSNCKCKNRFSCTAAHIFVFSGDAPAIITQYVAWMERQFNAC